ncbi:MAG: ABC transporter [Marinovum sp.]|nr:ABC transporter [Marinovum sp.]|tara:strand:+ start:723 stop:1505 length:783 start_codon:yes stop_codon:yes gene_type:complete
MSLLTLDKLSVFRGDCPVVDSVSLALEHGDFIGLIGPNGAGKTSLMRAALGILEHKGSSSLALMPQSDRAKQAAWLPQDREIAWGLSVRDLVGLGRLPFGSIQKNDRHVEAAIIKMELSTYSDRIATQLSGGEQARVLIARALAQDTPILMADEPTASLDPANQISTLKTFSTLAQAGRGIIASMHDLGLAARYCTKLALLHRGKLIAFGSADAVLTPDNLRTVFSIEAHYEKTKEGIIFQPLSVLNNSDKNSTQGDALK